MSGVNRRFLLRERPTGRIDDRTFELVEEPVPEIGEGEALVRTRWISLDPANRAWINDTPTYLPPVAIGDVMRASGLGEVVASNSPDYPVGRLVEGRTGWQDYAVASASAPMRRSRDPGRVPSHFLGALGMTGLTAYVGMLDIGRPEPGETVVVSAAAGAVGSVAGQLAKIQGARVVGIAGGPEKCPLACRRAGIRRGGRLQGAGLARSAEGGDPRRDRRRLRERRRRDHGGCLRAPERPRARGAVRTDLRLQRRRTGRLGRPAQLRQPADPARPPRGLHRARPLRSRTQVIAQLAEWMAEGKLKATETVVEGFEQLPVAINMLFDGQNTGKLVVKL